MADAATLRGFLERVRHRIAHRFGWNLGYINSDETGLWFECGTCGERTGFVPRKHLEAIGKRAEARCPRCRGLGRITIEAPTRRVGEHIVSLAVHTTRVCPDCDGTGRSQSETETSDAR